MPIRLRSRLWESIKLRNEDSKSAKPVSREFIRFPTEEDSKARLETAATSRALHELLSIAVRRNHQTGT